MAASPEIARANGMKGGRPKGSFDAKQLLRMRMKKKMDEMIVKKTAPLVRAAMSRALGQVFVYKIVEEKQEDTTRVLKNGEERVTPGKVLSRKHVRIEDPEEIAAALDAMDGSGSGTNEDEEYIYVTTKEPDTATIEMLLSRPYGRAKETIALEVEHKFSLTGLAEKRDEIIDGNSDVRLDTVQKIITETVVTEAQDAVVVEAPKSDSIVVEQHG